MIPENEDLGRVDLHGSDDFGQWDAGSFPHAEDPFDSELAHVHVSDWNIDADSIWGADPQTDVPDHGGAAFDLPM